MVDVNPKVTGGLDALELVAGMAAKPIVEKVVSPIAGNGTALSGIVKIGAAVVANKAIKGKVGNTAAVAFGADGAEDLILAIGGMKQAPTQGSEIDF